MFRFTRPALLAVGALSVLAAAPAEARCGKRLSKTEGAVVGAAGGAILGNVIAGGTTATILGAAAGGVAGHEIAKKGQRKCRYYRR
ncbi:glycine zipper 2TM domain-containing protein [Novosphingobium olei]|uniref:17 kDa surface antigen n=1 Tax=Novosphingobium olei TaxID=2728851 RepID=A0A7Y0G9L1_9SPHN|nr:glycine zipper 2TM domain-containing protein [Novosphingobium olei]NML93173.1 glycine zipper 2TM domain-containing protein [Novosphingobium olei]BEU99734.1 glycine zipper 2TM domain-containing protein [Novosphingobium olei]